MIISYFGDGKGKTTAALGLALRAAGWGKKVQIIHFIKNDWETGEECFIVKHPLITARKRGGGFVGIKGDNKRLLDHRKAARQALELAKEIMRQRDLFALILDEVFGAIEAKLISKEALTALINQKPRSLNLILTGAPKIPEIIALSDVATQMKKIKHCFDKEQLAKKGIDF